MIPTNGAKSRVEKDALLAMGFGRTEAIQFVLQEAIAKSNLMSTCQHI